ncbi:MAG: DHH family phosphoesterase, partial [Bacteroidota bacterium]|nr:DHH family phosphoesterase [Bacteroidota bacterium]
MTEADSPRASMRIVSPADARALLEAHRRFLVTTHVRPDADAVGSEIALAVFLRSAGKDVRIVNDSPLPANLAFLDPHGWVERYNPSRHGKLVVESDAIVFLDMNDGERAGSLAGEVRVSPACKIVIDHHLDPKPFADAYLVDTGVCATAEILYELLAETEDTLDPHAALGLYAGIMMDTGSFRFERTTPRVHRIAARLLEAGVDPTETAAPATEGPSGPGAAPPGEGADPASRATPSPQAPPRRTIVIHGTGDVSLDPSYIPAFGSNGYGWA